MIYWIFIWNLSNILYSFHKDMCEYVGLTINKNGFKLFFKLVYLLLFLFYII